jgi:hypothetical protein
MIASDPVAPSHFSFDVPPLDDWAFFGIALIVAGSAQVASAIMRC